MKKLLVGAALLAVAFAGGVLAQTIGLPTKLHANQNDYVQIIDAAGQGRAGNQYVTVGQSSGVQTYKALGSIGTTDPAATFAAGQVGMFAHTSGTIGTVTLTTEANPGDGQRECWWTDHTTTSLVWTANTGQTIDSNAQTAGIADTSACITYQASTAKWFSSN